MPHQKRTLFAMNRGIVSKLGLARLDVERTAMSAEVMTNWMPRVLGSMQLRAGWEHISNSFDDAQARYLTFVFSNDDTAQIEFTSGLMRVRVNDVLITRSTVAAAITNGSFDTDIAGWTNADEAGASSTWETGGYASLLGDGTNSAILKQTVAVSNSGVEHALRLIVARGPVTLRVGSTVDGEEYVNQTDLGVGYHSLSFTPTTANFYVQISNRRSYAALLDSIAVEGAGDMSLSTPWTADDLDHIRSTPSLNVIYLACNGQQQKKIERRGTRSWSIVDYAPENGPFRSLNASTITMTPTALTGDTQLQTSKRYFKPTMVGALFRIESNGQTVTKAISAENTFSDPIRVTGVGDSRTFSIIVTGTFVGTLTLQFSAGAPGTWVDAATYTAPTATGYVDGLDNEVIYYRIGIKTGDYTSGTATASLTYSAGGITGIARATEYVNELEMNAYVLQDFGALTPSEDWWEGLWSTYRGFPSSVCLNESRMCFSGIGVTAQSVSDDYENFDDTTVGDSGPILRSIGEGPVERIPWMLSLDQLILGIESGCANVDAIKILGNNPLSGRSSSFGEPLTPTNFNLKTSGATGAYVDTSQTRLLELAYDYNTNAYLPQDMTIAVPDLNDGIVQIVAQYKPDLRIYCRRSDGTIGVLVRDRAENVLAWCEIETDGIVEDISVMPGTTEDRVYLSVQRTVNGATKRFLEKVALESETRGNPAAYLADCFVRFESAETTAITGLDHLEGLSVVVWGWNTTNPFTDDQGRTVGRDLGTYTVVSGAITVITAITNACVGLAYTAQWKSGKQAFATVLGNTLGIRGRIPKIGLVLADTHVQGITYGPDFDNLDDLPLVEDEEEVDTNRVWADFDGQWVEFDGEWTTDSRVCLQAASPRPATVIALGIDQVKNG